ncbi:MAG: hypothetical protein RDV48_15495 [Candidatus Eremiobacteraeota bacterium]|nr:hypothetical protein [Candidatus Eremiobacteraeota bacterium]
MKKGFLEKLQQHHRATETATIFGEPRVYSSVTIIPVGRMVTSVMTDEDGAEREVREKSPLGYIEFRDDRVKFISLYETPDLIVTGVACGLGLYALVHALGRNLSKRSPQEEEKKSQNALCSVLKFFGISAAFVSTALCLMKLADRCSLMVCSTQGPIQQKINSLAREVREAREAQQEKEHKDDGHWNAPGVTIIDIPADNLKND